MTNWGLFLMLSVIWGSSFILIKTGLERLDAYQVASIRILSAGIVLLPFAIRSFRAVPAEKRTLVFLSGILGTFFPAYLFCIAETKIDSSLAGILNALTPIFTLLIAASVFKKNISGQKWTGVLLGFTGLVLLVMTGQQVMSFQYLSYGSLVLLATLFYAINVNMVNRYLKDIGSRDIATMAFTFLIIPSLVILYLTGYFSMDMDQAFIHATGAGILLGVLGTAAASVLFYMLLKRAGPMLASMVTYGIPFVAIFWGIIAGESISQMQVASLLVILAGVYLANK